MATLRLVRAIVLSGGYEDDFDDGHEIIYTGQVVKKMASK